MTSASTNNLPTAKPKPVRAVGPRLRKVFHLVLVLVALLGANAAYLAVVTFREWLTGETFQNYFYQFMFMLDKNGNRIDRRNAQDIFTPLYDHQIPPGAGQTVHYELTVPEDVKEPVTVEVKLQYRKFDQRYMDHVCRTSRKLGKLIRGDTAEATYRNELPITTLSEDRVIFPVAGAGDTVENAAVSFPLWQRWNDYGIGLLLKGKAELRQAEEAFRAVEELGRWDGPVNLARVYNAEGRLDEAVAALQRASSHEGEEGYPRWTWAWLSGVVDCDLDGRLDLFAANGHLEQDIHRVQPSQHYEQPPQLFWNCGPEQDTEFVPMTEKQCGSGLFRPLVGRGATCADIDGDGDLDLLVTATGQSPRLLRNDQRLGHHWLRLRLTGTQCNRDAIGARVEIDLGDRVLRRQVMPTRSYLSQVELPVTFGLGERKEAVDVRIVWPDGSIQVVEGMGIDRSWKVEQQLSSDPVAG